MLGYLQLPDGKKVEVANGLILGRTSSCDVVVKDNKASRRHAHLIVAGPVVEIEDLNSSNGTLLNDKPITRRMLRDGDVVQIGTTQITYHESHDQTPVPAATAPGQDLFADEPVEVLEFADDDVVKVPKATEPEPRRSTPPASRPPSFSATRTVVMPKRDRGLVPASGKQGLVIFDDLRQMSFMMRLLGLLAALGVALALGYMVYRLVS